MIRFSPSTLFISTEHYSSPGRGINSNTQRWLIVSSLCCVCRTARISRCPASWGTWRRDPRGSLCFVGFPNQQRKVFHKLTAVGWYWAKRQQRAKFSHFRPHQQSTFDRVLSHVTWSNRNIHSAQKKCSISGEEKAQRQKLNRIIRMEWSSNFFKIVNRPFVLSLFAVILRLIFYLEVRPFFWVELKACKYRCCNHQIYFCKPSYESFLDDLPSGTI